MLKKRIVITLTLNNGILFRTKKFNADYRYTKNFVDLWHLDELLVIDISQNNKLSETFLKTIKDFSDQFLVPITVGGGINNIEDVKKVLDNGADKVVINSGLINNPELIKSISNNYGSQVLIASIDLKKIDGQNKVTSHNGKKILDVDPLEWAKFCANNGVGEILINSIDRDGSLLGYDLELINYFSENLDVPILALGGAGNWDHIYELFKLTDISAACTQNIYHFTNQSLKSLKQFLNSKGINIRN